MELEKALKNALLQLNPSFTSHEITEGLSYFDYQNCKAKDLLLQDGKICDRLFFVQQSVTRCGYHNQQGEQTLWMKPAGTFLTDYKSFVSGQKSGFFLQLYEDAQVASITRRNLLYLYESQPSWAQFGVLLTEHQHVTLIDVFVNLLANDATRNYQYIEYAFPRFLQVAPLKDIASMLQISAVTLSRIRAGKQTK